MGEGVTEADAVGVGLGGVLREEGDGRLRGLALEAAVDGFPAGLRSGLGLTELLPDCAALTGPAGAVEGAVAGTDGADGPPVPEGEGSAARVGRTPRRDTDPDCSATPVVRGACGVHSTVPPPMGGRVG